MLLILSPSCVCNCHLSPPFPLQRPPLCKDCALPLHYHGRRMKKAVFINICSRLSPLRFLAAPHRTLTFAMRSTRVRSVN